MKKLTINTLLLVIATLLLGACSQGKERGAELGKSFAATWTAGDTKAIAGEAAAVRAAMDSLTFKGAFSDAFVEQIAATGDSTLLLAAQALTDEPADVAKTVAAEVVDGLLNGNLNYEQATARVMRVGTVSERLDMPDLQSEFGKQLDEKAESLSLSDQMKVYAAATTPDKLGRALAAEAATAGADQDLIKKQAEELKNILNEQDYKTFQENFKF